LLTECGPPFLPFTDRPTTAGKEKQRPVHVATVEAFAVAAGAVRDKTLRREAAARLAELALLHPDRRLAEAAAAGLIEERPQEAQYYDRCVRFSAGLDWGLWLWLCGAGRVG